MDRQEYRDIISAIKNNFKKKDYERVIMYARELPAKKIKENSVLEMIATSYEQLGKFNLARNTLETAYKRIPGGKHTAYKLALVSLKMKDVEGAVQYYEDFCKIAPNDNQRFLLKYEIAKVGNLSIYDRIRILEEYTAKETDDRWMYELARLYHDAGMGDKCAEMCDEIVVWFSDGDYLKRALELKFAHKALTPAQQAMYEKIMQDYIEDYEEPEPVIEEPSLEAEKEAEEFANDFLGDDEAQALYGDTKPLDIPEEQKYAQTKKIGLSESERIEVKKTVSEIADAKKNIFYDFRIEDATPSVTPGLNAWLNTLPDMRDENFQKSMREGLKEEAGEEGETFETENVERESDFGESPNINEAAEGTVAGAISAAAAILDDDVAKKENNFVEKEEIAGKTEAVLAEPEIEPEKEQNETDISDRFISEEEFDRRAGHAYSPALESIRETPILEQEYDHKRLEAEEGQLEVNFDLLKATEDEVDGQISIDQIFQTYANNIENNLENRAAVAKIEAERLRQIKEAVEQSMPATPVFDDEDEDGDAITEEYNGETDDAAEDIKEIAEAISEEPVADEVDPALKVIDDLVENEPEPVIDDNSGETKDRISFENADDIQIPDFLKDIKFNDEIEDDLSDAEEDADAYLDDEDDEILTMSTDDIDKEADEFADDFLAGSDIEQEEQKEADVVEAEKEVIAEKTEAEIEDELDDIGDFLAEVMGKDAEEAETDIADVETDDETVKEFSDEEDEEVESEEDDEDDIIEDIEDEEIIEEDSESEEVEEVAAEETEDAADAEEVEELISEETEDEAAEAEVSDPAIKETEAEKAVDEDNEELDELGDVLADIFGGEKEDSEIIDDAETGETSDDEAVEVYDDEVKVSNVGTDFKAIEAEIADVENIAADDDFLDEDLEAFLEDIDIDEDEEEIEEVAAESEEDEEIEDESVEVISEETEDESVEAEADEEATDTDEDEAETDEDEEVILEETEDEELEEAKEVVSEETEDEVAEVDTDEAEAETEEVGEEISEETEETVEEDANEATESEEMIETDSEENDEALSDDNDSETAENTDDELTEGADGISDEDEPDADDVTIKEEKLSDTQPLEKVQKFSLDEETKEEIAEFLLIDGMREVVTNTVNDMIINKRAGDPTGGNLIVTGDAKCGKTFLAISIIKAVNKELQSGSGKVAKVQSESLNGKDIKKVFQKITGNDLIIENVGDLEEKTINDISEAMSDGTFNDLLVFEGNMLAVETILNNHPEMEALFSNRVDISELSISGWADVACDYAKRKGYRVGDMALLALHAKIDEINLPTRRFGYEDVVNIMEAAIEHCDKRNTGKLFTAFSKKEEEGIELNESDFA